MVTKAGFFAAAALRRPPLAAEVLTARNYDVCEIVAGRHIAV
jgi:hypothetical protein